MKKIPIFGLLLPVWLTFWSDHQAFMGSNERYGPYELWTQVFFLVRNMQCMLCMQNMQKLLEMKKIHII